MGFCAATGMRAVVVTGDGSLDLTSPMRVAVKHGLLLTIVVLNDSGVGLPFFASGRSGALHAQATMPLPAWDFTRQGSPLVGGRRVCELGSRGCDIACVVRERLLRRAVAGIAQSAHRFL